MPSSDDGVWKWTFVRYEEELRKDNIVFKETTSSALVTEEKTQSKWNLYNKVWLRDQQDKGVVPSNYIGNYENRQSSSELKALNIPFDLGVTRIPRVLARGGVRSWSEC